jgi:hypothetical protein|uniref:Peptidase M15A C-terminal domain-containing protein n=1 Tax=candidate division WOR-3 bacterium TaxID=2052148 RepID=A0A7C3Z2K8_UNCW3
MMEGNNEIEKEGKELEISFTAMDSLLCRCCRSVPAEYLKNLDQIKKILIRLSRSLPFKLIILSGYRCLRHNARVGGEKDSPHRKGLAVDIYCPKPKERFLLIKQMILVGIQRIIIYEEMPSVIHFDLDENKPRPFFALKSKEKGYV